MKNKFQFINSIKTPPITRHHRFIRYLAFLTSIFTIIFITYMIFNLSASRKNISTDRIQMTAGKIKSEFNLFLASVTSNLMAAQTWGESGMINMANSNLHASFIPILQKMPQISSVMVANDKGLEFLLLRGEDGVWRTRSTKIDTVESISFWMNWDDMEPLEDDVEEVAPQYDPRNMPWFTNAVKNNKDSVCWTPLDTLPALNGAGITASVAWSSKENDSLRINYVLAYNISASEITEFNRSINDSSTTRIFLITEDGYLIGKKEQQNGGGGSLIPLNKIEDDVIALAIQSWLKANDKKEAFNLKMATSSWWSGFEPLTKDNESFWVGIAIPERELLEEYHKKRLTLVLISMGILILGIFTTILLLQIYNRQLRQILTSGYTSEEELLHLIERGESDKLEFKSTLRRNLKSNQYGKEIELAWLKTISAFLNTHGGILLIGVADDGEILGIGVDKFENDDKYLLHFNNRFKQHLGLEFIEYVRFSIEQVKGKKILVVECEQAHDPVFLKANGDEEFYIRVGPGSRKMKMSEAMKFIQNRANVA